MRRAACARAVAVVVVPLLLLASRAAVSRAAGGAPASPPPASPRADDACAADNAACSAEDASGAAAAARLRGFLGSARDARERVVAWGQWTPVFFFGIPLQWGHEGGSLTPAHVAAGPPRHALTRAAACADGQRMSRRARRDIRWM